MRAKQVLAKVFASAMVFSTLFGTSVMAADVIEGGTIYIDQEIIDVTLPTTTSQKFYLDPQGLIAVGKTSGGDVANEGQVVGLVDMYAVNRSSVPLALSVSYQVVDDEDGDVSIATSTTNSGTDIKDASGRTVAVTVSAVESSEDANSGAGAYGGHVFEADDENGVDITATTGLTTAVEVFAGDSDGPTEASYLMTAESYKVVLKEGAEDIYDSNSYDYVVDTTAKKASCVKLTIGGYCSTKADWSDYANGTKELKLNVVFKFTKVTSDDEDYTDAKTGADVELGPKVTITTDGKITISGLTTEKTLNAIEKVVVIGPDFAYPLANNTTTTDLAGYDAATKAGTIKYTLLDPWKAINDKAVKVEVTLSDGSKITSNSVTISL